MRKSVASLGQRACCFGDGLFAPRLRSYGALLGFASALVLRAPSAPAGAKSAAQIKAANVPSLPTLITKKAGTKALFAAELGSTKEILGLGVEANLSPTDSQGESHRAYPPKSDDVDVDQYDSEFESVRDNFSLDAHGRYLFVKAGVSVSSTARFMVLRVAHISRVSTLKVEGKPLAKVPMFASKMFYGWAMYIVIEGTDTSLTTEVEASLLQAGGDLKALVAKHNLKSKVHLIGLTPKEPGSIPIVRTGEEVAKAFTPSKKPQPIYVEYTTMQDIPTLPIQWSSTTLKPGKYRLSAVVEVMPTKKNGKAWDEGNPAPDPLVTLLLNGKNVGACRETDVYKSTCLVKVIDLQPTTTISLDVKDVDTWSGDDPIGGTDPINLLSPTPRKANVDIALTPTEQVKSATIRLEPVAD